MLRSWQEAREERRRLIAQRRAAGLCPVCGERELPPSYQSCFPCQCDRSW